MNLFKLNNNVGERKIEKRMFEISLNSWENVAPKSFILGKLKFLEMST